MGRWRKGIVSYRLSESTSALVWLLRVFLDMQTQDLGIMTVKGDVKIQND